MDKIHDDHELKIYEKIEKNFDRKEYLTIKNKDGIVIGRIYNINSIDKLPLNKIDLSEREIDIILAFFKFFEIAHSDKIAQQIAKQFHINLKEIDVDIIRNNVFKQEVY